MRELWGLPPDAPVGQDLFAGLPPADYAALAASVERACDPAGSGEFELAPEQQVRGRPGAEEQGDASEAPPVAASSRSQPISAAISLAASTSLWLASDFSIGRCQRRPIAVTVTPWVRGDEQMRSISA